MFLHKLRPIGHVVSQAPPKWPFRCSERVRIARYTQSPRIPATGLDTDTPPATPHVLLLLYESIYTLVL